MNIDDYIYPVAVYANPQTGVGRSTISRWLIENNIRAISEITNMSSDKIYYTFFFKDETDALLFALRWGGS